ncbi:hypothetical protein AAFF_G00140890 [Aldrovandia affinis]|uniref:Uncharacterized protein n=1 Tax=Aldrovandia affinis TaxID=143900 RepID=A0AAD7X2Y4_9TELE|nr:hypothetical protein AAFF_G00140890 [Aldrovandia affinis]
MKSFLASPSGLLAVPCATVLCAGASRHGTAEFSTDMERWDSDPLKGSGEKDPLTEKAFPKVTRERRQKAKPSEFPPNDPPELISDLLPCHTKRSQPSPLYCTEVCNLPGFTSDASRFVSRRGEALFWRDPGRKNPLSASQRRPDRLQPSFRRRLARTGRPCGGSVAFMNHVFVWCTVYSRFQSC